MAAALVEAEAHLHDGVGVRVDDVDEEGVAGVELDLGVRALEVRLGGVEAGDAPELQVLLLLQVVAGVSERGKSKREVSVDCRISEIRIERSFLARLQKCPRN